MRILRSPEATTSRPRALAAAMLLLLPLAAHSTFAQPKPAPTTVLPAGPRPTSTRTRPASTSTAPRPAGPRPSPQPAPSSSSDAGEPADAGDEVGRLYTEGYTAFQAGDFRTADSALTKAWGLSKSFDVAATLGSAKLELDKHREAAQYLSFALRNALPSTRAGVRDRIKRDLDNARGHLATIKISANLVEAKIAVDGAIIDPLFLGPEIYVDPGKRTFQATAEGYTPATTILDVKSGEIRVVKLTLERTSAPKGGGLPPPVPTAQSIPLPAALLGGAGGIAVVAGAVLIGAAESSKSNTKDLVRNTLDSNNKPTCPTQGPGPTDQCDQLRAAAASADTFGNVGIGIFVGAGVLIAGATVYMLFINPDPSPAAPEGQGASGPTSHLIPVIGPEGGGLVWRGSF